METRQTDFCGDFRFQISDPRRHKAADFGTFPLSKISASPENSMTALLQISAQRRRSQIAQITSHRRCAREKEKSGAAVDIWRLQIPAKEIPFFSASCGLRILSEGAVCRSPLCRSRILQSRKHAEQIPGPVEICKTRYLRLCRVLRQVAAWQKSRLTDPKRSVQSSMAVKSRAEF